MKFVSGGIEKDNKQGKARMSPEPGTGWATAERFAQRAPNQQSEYGVFGQVGAFADGKNRIVQGLF